MKRVRALTVSAAVLALMVASANVARGAERLMPYVLAEQAPAVFDEKVAAVRQALQGGGFQVAGEADPYEGAHVFVVTSDALRQAAAASSAGGFGAAQRVAVTKVGDQVQVAYTNPVWMANVYRMGPDLADVASALGAALGSTEAFGSKNGIPAKDLRSYHYMVFMPYFTDQVKLAEHGSHEEALAKVEAGLAAGEGVRKVARVDVPGKEESLFAVAILAGDGADAAVMKTCDGGELKHTAHLPYELLVSGKKVLMLHGKFRIAQSFPDLTMGTFMKISGAPDGIEKVLRAAVQ